MQARYGFPYMVIHRSDLHATFLRACQRTGVELVNNVKVTAYEQVEDGARAISDGRADEAEVVIAADGIRSVARGYLVQDEPQSSAYVAYRGAVPIGDVMDNEVSLKDVVVYIGPRCHFVQYPLRQGEMFNQVAVFQSPKALRGEEDGHSRRAGGRLRAHRSGASATRSRTFGATSGGGCSTGCPSPTGSTAGSC